MTSTTPTTAQPLRDAVAALGLDLEKVAHPHVVRYMGDTPVTTAACASDGSLFVWCGGPVVLAFRTTRPGSPTLAYLVVDDSEGERYDRCRRAGADPIAEGCGAYRAHARLRLAIPG